MKIKKCLLLTYLVFAALLLTGGNSYSQDKNLKPFPQNVDYTTGSILPNHKNRTQLNQDVIRVYERWKKNYLTEDISTKGQYYIKYQDKANGPVTVSEAHGYGMLTFVYMAGADPLAKQYFDGMFYFFKVHPSKSNPDLMNWQQTIKDGKVISIGNSCATDGDMDIAYSLLLADKQWGSTGKINYRKEALQIIKALEKSIVHTRYKTLKMGDWAGNEGTRVSDATRPSDFMFQHMKAFKKATGNGIWEEVVANTYGICNYIFTNYSSQTGLLPDFAEHKDEHFIPAEGRLLEANTDGSYSYNSARTPWRIATDHLLDGDNRALKQLSTLNLWIKKSTNDNPGNIRSGYTLDGETLNGRSYQDLTYQAPFMVSAMIAKENQEWLNKLWENTVNNHRSYFGDSIAMLCLIVTSGNWWQP